MLGDSARRGFQRLRARLRACYNPTTTEGGLAGAGKVSNADQTTQILTEFRNVLSRRGVTGNTITTYLKHLRQYRTWCQEYGIDLVRSTYPDLESHLEMVYKNHAQLYGHARRTALRAFFQWAASTEIRNDDPSSKLRVNRDIVTQPLTMPELRRLVKAAYTAEERAVLLVLLGTGIRKSELLDLRVADVDWLGGTVTVHGRGLADRTVRPGAHAMGALKALVAEAEIEANAARPLFPMSKTTLTRLLNRVGARSNVQKVTPARIRVTAIVDRNESQDVAQRAEFSGHVQTASTQRYEDPQQQASTRSHRANLVDRVSGIP